MFNAIAPGYDRMNRLMTFGQDRRMRSQLLRMAELRPGMAVLDLACGTGDLALAIGKSLPEVRVVAADFSTAMLELARSRPGAQAIQWIEADAHSLPFADASFDRVLFGFLLRNVEDEASVLREIFRVLKPGGAMLSLDTTPPSGLPALLLACWFALVIPLLARLTRTDRSAYRYLYDSTTAFHPPEQLAANMAAAGFHRVSFHSMALGAIALHRAERPESLA
jgi:demethylmenaquinone methyltransferase/2-methoxy-6-polyprenyl-1,4-benzoquinol methylase